MASAQKRNMEIFRKMLLLEQLHTQLIHIKENKTEIGKVELG